MRAGRDHASDRWQERATPELPTMSASGATTTTVATRRDLPVVTFIQPYVPEYRVPLFDELAARLKDRGHRLAVAHGEPLGHMARRQDARLGSWSVPVRTYRLGSSERSLSYRPLLRLARKSAIVVAELASTNLDTYLLAADPRVSLMLWGHGRSYVTDRSNIDRRLEGWLARHADRLFVYTESGAEYLESSGFDRRRLTVVRNSTDTVTLRAEAAALTTEDVNSFRRHHGLGTGPVVSFIGSYDESKCLPLLIEAADLMHSRLPDLQLVITGAGPLQSLVDEAAATRSFVHSLPRADLPVMARLGRASDFLVVPGRVGLVAVDALALGLPVVTTDFAYHAPELDYLTDAVKIVAKQEAADLARQVVDLICDQPRLAAARIEAQRLGGTLSIQAMAAAFCDGLVPRHS
jgi:glycosyltransferase involved in cell wall biosynthesis